MLDLEGQDIISCIFSLGGSNFIRSFVHSTKSGMVHLSLARELCAAPWLLSCSSYIHIEVYISYIC